MALVLDAIIQSVKDALVTGLDAVLDEYDAEASVTLPRFTSRHITFGLEALSGRPVNSATIWVRLGQVTPLNVTHGRVNSGYRDLEVPVHVRVFVPVLAAKHELMERHAVILSEAVVRVLEYQMARSEAYAVYFALIDLLPAPLTEEGAKGMAREVEVVMTLHARTSRHNLVP